MRFLVPFPRPLHPFVRARSACHAAAALAHVRALPVLPRLLCLSGSPCLLVAFPHGWMDGKTDGTSPCREAITGQPHRWPVPSVQPVHPS
jgi:hypothetical protein